MDASPIPGKHARYLWSRNDRSICRRISWAPRSKCRWLAECVQCSFADDKLTNRREERDYCDEEVCKIRICESKPDGNGEATVKTVIGMAGILTITIYATSLFAAGDAAAGKADYAKKCASCHGQAGEGKDAIAKSLKVELKHLGSKEVQAMSDADLKKSRWRYRQGETGQRSRREIRR